MNRWKPHGLWVSDDDDYGWADWCRGAGFRAFALKYRYKITLAESHNVLIIKNRRQFKKFHKEFSLENDPRLRNNPFIDLERIDWSKVMKVYDGVIITPYRWEFRFYIWYNGWDCASGCIWNRKAVKSIRQDRTYKS